MSSQNNTQASEEQAIETTEATDSEQIVERLPEDVQDRLTKRAFSPGALRLLLRDTYYMGPIGIGTGGWIGMYGDGQPGTEMRRPNGALYGFPRSWRYAALERAMKTALVTHVGDGDFATTERGVAVLEMIDRCPDHDLQRKPMVRHSYYRGSPYSEGHIENHELITACPECGGNGYDWGYQGSSYEPYERTDARLEYVREQVEDVPKARVFGIDRETEAAIPLAFPDFSEEDLEAIDEVLDEHVEHYTAPTARKQFGAATQDVYDRPVVTVPDSKGKYYHIQGTDDELRIYRQDYEATIHISWLADEEMYWVQMSYEIAVEEEAKEAVKSQGLHEWDNENKRWLLEPEGLPHVLSVLAGYEDKFGRWTVSVTQEAVDACPSPLPGIDAEGDLVDTEEDDSQDEVEEFLDGDEDEFEELEEPPMADSEDPLLDGDRLELDAPTITLSDEQLLSVLRGETLTVETDDGPITIDNEGDV